MFNILVTGVNGQLGSEIKELSSNYLYNFYFTNKDDLDITNEKAIEEFIAKHDITVIINCAAYTAVDKAEFNQELADKINHQAIKYFAIVAKENNIKLIHISTDYVFDGIHHIPYLETDLPNPLSVYGKTKFLGEKILQEIDPRNSILIRTSWMFSTYGTNFVKTMIKLGKEKETLGVVFDQVGTPTYAKDLAKMILDILPKIQNETLEIYHYTNEGVTSWYDFAKEIMQMAKLTCKVYPIETEDYPLPAKRPHYSLLNKAKIKKTFGIEIPYWKNSLERCLIEMGERK